MQPWSLQDAVYSGSSSPPKLAFEELVDDNLLLTDFLVCHRSHLLRPHFDERIHNELDL